MRVGLPCQAILVPEPASSVASGTLTWHMAAGACRAGSAHFASRAQSVARIIAPQLQGHVNWLRDTPGVPRVSGSYGRSAIRIWEQKNDLGWPLTGGGAPLFAYAQRPATTVPEPPTPAQQSASGALLKRCVTDTIVARRGRSGYIAPVDGAPTSASVPAQGTHARA